MIFKTLYEANENNNELHRGIPEVALAEAEVKVFLSALNSDVRLAADALLGRLARAYEMQGFLFGGNVAGEKWGDTKAAAKQTTGKQSAPKKVRNVCKDCDDERITKERSASTPQGKYFSFTMLPVRQLNRKTGAVMAEYESLAAAERATGIDARSISKACKGELYTSGGCLWEFATA